MASVQTIALQVPRCCTAHCDGGMELILCRPWQGAARLGPSPPLGEPELSMLRLLGMHLYHNPLLLATLARVLRHMTISAGSHAAAGNEEAAAAQAQARALPVQALYRRGVGLDRNDAKGACDSVSFCHVVLDERRPFYHACQLGVLRVAVYLLARTPETYIPLSAFQPSAHGTWHLAHGGMRGRA